VPLLEIEVLIMELSKFRDIHKDCVASMFLFETKGGGAMLFGPLLL
jgi:hypothetical protein